MLDVIGLITARGDSKGIPRKNIAPLAGKPLIAWTIEAARQSQTLREVIVSTDDREIAATSQHWGADVPFMRPAELAQDHSSQIAVVLHALHWLAAHRGRRPDYVMLLQPTVPLRTAYDVDAAIKLAAQTKADSVISVCPANEHPYLTKTLLPDGRLQDFMHHIDDNLPRQTLPDVYVLNGAIYLIRPHVLAQNESWYNNRTYAYVMPRARSLDIDTAWDLYLVDLVLRDQTSRSADRLDDPATWTP